MEKQNRWGVIVGSASIATLGLAAWYFNRQRRLRRVLDAWCHQHERKKRQGCFFRFRGCFLIKYPAFFLGGITSSKQNQDLPALFQPARVGCNSIEQILMQPIVTVPGKCWVVLAEGIYCLGWLCKKTMGLVTILRRRLLLRTKGGPKPVLNLSKKVFQGFPEV